MSVGKGGTFFDSRGKLQHERKKKGRISPRGGRKFKLKDEKRRERGEVIALGGRKKEKGIDGRIFPVGER